MKPAEKLLVDAGYSQTYWGREIIAAEKRDGFLDLNRYRAGDWTTCACGQLNDGIPRSEGGKPLDILLRRLGNSFFNAVEFDAFESAASLLIQIEKRAAEILA